MLANQIEATEATKHLHSTHIHIDKTHTGIHIQPRQQQQQLNRSSEQQLRPNFYIHSFLRYGETKQNKAKTYNQNLKNRKPIFDKRCKAKLSIYYYSLFGETKFQRNAQVKEAV